MKVLDASAWIDVLVADLHIPQIAEHELCVPPHFDVEVVGSIRALEQRELLNVAKAGEAVDRHVRGVFERVNNQQDIRSAWNLRHRLSFRDAWYVSLASRLDVAWITTDHKAAQTARSIGVTTEVH